MVEQNSDPMEYIWERIPKTKEGLIHYLEGDIPYLYQNGFVDTTAYSYQEWKEAFNDCLQSDGSYLVNRDKFMSLRRYRYEGPVWKPFDAQKVRDGEWSDADLQKLFEKSIQPSSGITEEIFWNSVKALKKQGMVNNGNLLVNPSVKKQLAYLIERFPSPRRKLETEVHRLREERETKYRQVAKERDSSQFTTGQLASEAKLEKFKQLEGKSSPETSDEGNQEGIDIKKLKRPPRKIGV